MESEILKSNVAHMYNQRQYSLSWRWCMATVNRSPQCRMEGIMSQMNENMRSYREALRYSMNVDLCSPNILLKEKPIAAGVSQFAVPPPPPSPFKLALQSDMQHSSNAEGGSSGFLPPARAFAGARWSTVPVGVCFIMSDGGRLRSRERLPNTKL